MLNFYKQWLHSSVRTVTRLRDGRPGFDSRYGQGVFLFTTASKTTLEPTQPPIQWLPGALSPRIKRPGREVNHTPPPSAEVKNGWSYTYTPLIRLHGVMLS
jgi:hypothetical protein